MANLLDEHRPYEVQMLFVTHDTVYPTHQLSAVQLNVVIECFCIHARNLFEFFTRTKGGKDNYAFAKAYVPDFTAFRDPQARNVKDALYRKICAQISHLTFNRVKDSPEKFRTSHEVPEAKRLLEPEIRAFVNKLPHEYRQHWNVGVAKGGLSHWGF
jgi:hypothetical protein